jgi:diguanylate cyclase (GGDEF)-like protein
MHLTVQRKLFLSHFVAIVLVSGSVGTFFYRVAVDSLFESLQARLKYSAALLSRTLDARRLAEIRSREDVSHPAYRDGLKLLRDFQGANSDVAFIYVMRREGDRVTFVLDSDTSPNQAQPGQEYTAVIPSLLRGFDELSADPEIARDQWGYFLSGYAPLRGSAGTYLVGIDMRADEVQHKLHAIRATGLASLAVSLILAWLFSAWLARRITSPVRTLLGRTAEIANGMLEGQVTVATGDELQELATSFNRMSSRLAASRDEARQAMAELQGARDHLEARVVERTRELAELNEELRREIAVRRRAEEALARAATTDFLTGLLNRPAVLRLLEQEVERVRRGTREFSVILADVDNLKEVNDTLGHEAGDQVLQQLGALLKDCVRSQDAVARWGGDELLLFLPETPLEGALEVGRKLLLATAECPQLVDTHELQVTLSMGVSAAAPGMSVNECIRLADLALSRAKAGGRNRVAAATETDQTTES